MKLNFNIIKYLSISFFIVILIFISSIDMSAQCPMCRMAAESNMENGGTSGRGLNAGIIYMLSIPYVSIALFIYILYKNRKSKLEKS